MGIQVIDSKRYVFAEILNKKTFCVIYMVCSCLLCGHFPDPMRF